MIAIPWSEIALKVPSTLYENRSLIQGWWTKLLALTGFGNINVVILGRPSVGKSVLSAHLHGETSNLTYQLPKTSVKVETKAIQFGDWTKIIRVIPGQSNKERAQGLEEAFHEHTSLEGLIYVVDWGYTNVRDETIREKLIKDEGLDTVEKLRQYNLKSELKDFESVLAQLQNAYSNNRAPKWLAIAVNKVDLFYSKINLAQSYYHPESISPFTDSLNATLNNIGRQNIKCMALPISSWDTSFNWNGEVVKTEIGGKEIEHGLSHNFIINLAEMSK